jgi:hypothetical protein
MLSRAAMEDVRNGLLSPATLRELMILRLRIGEPLFDVANYAKVAGEEATAERIINIKTTNIPAEVKQEFETMKRVGFPPSEQVREAVETNLRDKINAERVPLTGQAQTAVVPVTSVAPLTAVQV